MPSHDLQLFAEKIKFDALFEYAALGILVVNQKGEIIFSECLFTFTIWIYECK